MILMDLMVRKNSLEAARKGLPVARPPFGPPVTAASFISDAAGTAHRWWNGMRVNGNKPGDWGVATVSFEGKQMTFRAKYRWP